MARPRNTPFSVNDLPDPVPLTALETPAVSSRGPGFEIYSSEAEHYVRLDLRLDRHKLSETAFSLSMIPASQWPVIFALVGRMYDPRAKASPDLPGLEKFQPDPDGAGSVARILAKHCSAEFLAALAASAYAQLPSTLTTADGSESPRERFLENLSKSAETMATLNAVPKQQPEIRPEPAVEATGQEVATVSQAADSVSVSQSEDVESASPAAVVEPSSPEQTPEEKAALEEQEKRERLARHIRERLKRNPGII